MDNWCVSLCFCDRIQCCTLLFGRALSHHSCLTMSVATADQPQRSLRRNSEEKSTDIIITTNRIFVSHTFSACERLLSMRETHMIGPHT